MFTPRNLDGRNLYDKIDFMRDYELTLILSPVTSEAEVNDTTQELISFLQEEGGILYDQTFLGKKPLLAPVKHQTEGYLGLVRFGLHPEKLSSLEKKCKEKGQILRFMMLSRPPKRVEKSEKMILAKSSQSKQETLLTQQREPATQTPLEENREKKVDLQDIEEKLKEIFKE